MEEKKEEEETFAERGREHKHKHKHKKKDKKHRKKGKKEKKEKRHKRSREEEDETAFDEEEWVVKTPPHSQKREEEDEENLLRTPPRSEENGESTSETTAQLEEPKLQRQEWMLRPWKRTKPTHPVEEEPPPKEEPPAKINPKELNPYAATGGLPPEKRRSASIREIGLGDGGSKWQQMAVQRTIERAREEGRNVEEALRNRFGEDFLRRGTSKGGWRSGPSTSSPGSLTTAPTSTEDINRLEAQLLKAEMMGDDERVAELKSKLEEARSAPARPRSNEEEEEVIVLPTLDKRGRPIVAPRTQAGSRGQTRHAQSSNLLDMVAEERDEDSSRYNLDFAKLVAKNQNLMEDDMADIPGSFEGAQGKRKQKRGKSGRSAVDTQKQRAIAAYNANKKLVENCNYCFDNKKFPRHLIISLGDKVYLTQPQRGVLVEGHCQLVPMQHELACTMVDEDVWEEFQRFKQSLTKMFAAQDKVPIFMETVTNLKKRWHTVVDCVPLPSRDAEVAPAYFKKALLEAEGEWSQNKKVVDTRERGLRRSIPPDFPYFSVEFGMGGGYAHVIEDAREFPRNFGRDVVAGVVELPPQKWGQGQRDTLAMEKARTLAFLNHWEPFDWTASLEGGQY
ncbi:DWNN a CCHC-type zinc finger [Balamuthia mandrillaris]